MTPYAYSPQQAATPQNATAGGSPAQRRVNRARTVASAGAATNPNSSPAVSYGTQQNANPQAGAAVRTAASPSMYAAPAAAPVRTAYNTATAAPTTPTGQRLPPGVSQQDIDWAKDASEAVYIGKSDGKMRFKGASGKEYTNDDRNHATKAINDPTKVYNAALRDPMSEASLRDQAGNLIQQSGQNVAQLGQGYYDQDAQAGHAIDAQQNWNPTDLEGWDTQELHDLQATNLQNFNPTELQNFNSAELRGVDLSQLQNYKPTNMAGVNTSGLKGYDAGGAMQKYLAANGGGDYDTSVAAGRSNFDAMQAVEGATRGNVGLSKAMLGDQLETEANSAARSGRLNTGLYDRDKGRVITRVGEDLNNRLLASSVDAAGIQSSIENANSGNLTQANIASARERGNMAGLRSSEARDAAQLGYSAQKDALGYDVDLAQGQDELGLRAADAYATHGINRAEGIDRNMLQRGEGIDKFGFDKASGIDKFNLDRTTNWTNAEGDKRQGLNDSRYKAIEGTADNRLRRADLSGKLWDSAQDRQGELISGERDRVTDERNYQDDVKFRNRQAKNAWWQSGLTGASQVGSAYLGRPRAGAAPATG